MRLWRKSQARGQSRTIAAKATEYPELLGFGDGEKVSRWKITIGDISGLVLPYLLGTLASLNAFFSLILQGYVRLSRTTLCLTVSITNASESTRSFLSHGYQQSRFF